LKTANSRTAYNIFLEEIMTKLKDLHPQYITNEAGERTSVILSIFEFQELLEEVEDLALTAERRDEPPP
jgi:hypothetical protein